MLFFTYNTEKNPLIIFPNKIIKNLKTMCLLKLFLFHIVQSFSVLILMSTCCMDQYGSKVIWIGNFSVGGSRVNSNRRVWSNCGWTSDFQRKKLSVFEDQASISFIIHVISSVSIQLQVSFKKNIRADELFLCQLPLIV